MIWGKLSLPARQSKFQYLLRCLVTSVIFALVPVAVYGQVSGPSNNSSGTFTLTYAAPYGNKILRQYRDGVKEETHVLPLSGMGGNITINVGRSGAYEFQLWSSPPGCMQGPPGSCDSLVSNGSRSVNVVFKPNPTGTVTANAESGNTDTNGQFSVRWDAAEKLPRDGGHTIRYEIQQRFRPKGGTWGSWYPATPYKTSSISVAAQSLKGVSRLTDGEYTHRVRSYVSVGGYRNQSGWKSPSIITVRNKPGQLTGLKSTVDPLPNPMPEGENSFTMQWNAVNPPVSG